jgi:hypothetical protein
MLHDCRKQARAGFLQPVLITAKERLSRSSDFAVAITAIYRSVATWFERHFRALAACRTGHGEHLASSTSIAAVPTRSPLCLTACRTTLRLILIAPGLEQFLLVCTKRERSSTVCACQGLVLVTQG